MKVNVNEEPALMLEGTLVLVNWTTPDRQVRIDVYWNCLGWDDILDCAKATAAMERRETIEYCILADVVGGNECFQESICRWCDIINEVVGAWKLCNECSRCD